jgi:hypothetical protein
MPFNALRGGTVKDETNWVPFVLPDFAGYIITMLKFIDKTFASVVQQETSNTTKSLSGQELDFRIRLVGIDETSGMDLNLLKVDSTGTYAHSKLLTIASTVIAIGCRKVPILWPVLLEE